MEHEHTEHVAAPPNQVFAAIADPENLPHYVPQLTSILGRGRRGGAAGGPSVVS
jgi:carbon monoxide dehydrogenase subunit G